MAREFSVSFALGATLDSSYGSAFKAATGQVRGITQAIRDMEQSPVGRLGSSLVNQQKAIRGTRAELDRARGVLDALRAQADAAGGASGRLAIQIRQAETEVSGLTSRLERQNSAFAETRARAATAGGSVQGLINQYRQLRGEIESQRTTKARVESGLEIARAEDSQRTVLRDTLAATPKEQRRSVMATMVGEQSAALKGLGTQLRTAHQQLATLRARADAAGGASGTLARQIRQAEDSVNVLNRQVRLSGAAFRETVAAATGAGGSIRELSREYRGLAENAARAQRIQQAVQANRQRRDTLRSQRDDLNGRLMGTAAQAATVAMPVKLAVDYESSMADVKKVTDFDDTGFKMFSQDLLEMSTRLPMTAKGLAEIAAAAGAAGIKQEELLVFSEDAAKMGVAFDISAKEAGNAMTGLRNNFKLSQDGVRLLGDSMNALANSMDAKAAQIVDFANRTGGAAKIYGFTGQEVAALGATFLDAKVGAEEASTATNAMFVRLGTADTLSKDAQEAFQSLGMSGEGMAKAFRQDAQGALLHFMQTVAKSKDPMRALNAIFGAEHAPKIARLVNNLNRYDMALDKVSTTEKYRNSMQQEYDTRADTTANHIQLLQNSMTRFGTIVGTALLPVVSAVVRGLSGVATRAGDLAQRFPRTTAVFMTGATVIAGLAVSGLALGLVINGVKTSVASLRSATLLLSNSQRLATAQTWAMAAAGKAWGVASRIAGAGSRFFAGGLRSILVASGVGALLVALGFAVDFVIEHWGTIGPALKGIWDGIVGTISQTVGSIINFFVIGWASITDTWNRLGVFFSVLGGNLLKVFEPAITFITGLFSRAKNTCLQVWSSVTGFFSGLWGGVTSAAESTWTWITDAASTAWDGVTGLWNGVTSFFAVMWDGVSAGAGVMWGWMSDAASGAWNGIVSVWEGATNFFGGLCYAITGVFASMFQWLRDSFDWVFSTIDTVKSAVDKVTGAVSDAWNTAFGDDGETPSEKSTPVASAAPEPPKAISMSTSGKKAAQTATPVSESPAKPSYQSRADAVAGLASTPASSSNKKGKGGKKGKGAGPVTVVSLDSGNKFSTVFIPAASKKDKDASKPVGTSVLLPSSGDSETVAFSKAGQNLVGGLNKTLDRLPKLFDASLSKVSEPDIPPAVVNIPASSSSPQPAPRAIFHPVQRQDRSGSPFAVLKNALGSAPDQWSRTVGAKFGRDALPPVLPQTPMLLERNKKASAQRQPEASGDIQIVQHFNIADAGNLPALKKELRRLEPEFEKLVRRALERMRSDKARTAHAQ